MSARGLDREDVGLVGIFVGVIGAIPGLREWVGIRIGGNLAWGFVHIIQHQLGFIHVIRSMRKSGDALKFCSRTAGMAIAEEKAMYTVMDFSS